jgi:hypothetical protein
MNSSLDGLPTENATKYLQQMIRAKLETVPLSRLNRCSGFTLRTQNEMQKRKGHPATGWPLLQGRIVPTELENPSKLSATNLMSLKTGVSRDFYEINVFVFNDLQNQLISAASVAD